MPAEKVKARMGQKVKNQVFLQLLNILFSLSSVLIKVASDRMQTHGFFSVPTFAAIGGYVLILGIYAVFWQRAIKNVSLSTAYLSKGLVIFWTLLWSALLFHEGITVWNLAGAAVIVAGTVLVAGDE